MWHCCDLNETIKNCLVTYKKYIAFYHSLPLLFIMTGSY